MLTLDNLISVISLCLTSLGIGITLGYALGQIHAKKITAPILPDSRLFFN